MFIFPLTFTILQQKYYADNTTSMLKDELNLNCTETDNLNLKLRHVKCWSLAILYITFYENKSSESEDWILTNFLNSKKQFAQ